MKSKFSYKGYRAKITFSEEDQTFVGRVSDIEPLLIFSGDSVEELSEGFHTAIDDYLALCVARNIEAEKACSGTFNVRVGPELHRRAVSASKASRMSLNEVIKRALGDYLDRQNMGRREKVIVEPISAVLSVTQVAPIAGAWEDRTQDEVEGSRSGWRH